MKEKAFTPEQIIGLLAEEKVLFSQGNTVWKVSRSEPEAWDRRADVLPLEEGVRRDVDGIESKVRCFGLLVPI